MSAPLYFLRVQIGRFDSLAAMSEHIGAPIRQAEHAAANGLGVIVCTGLGKPAEGESLSLEKSPNGSVVLWRDMGQHSSYLLAAIEKLVTELTELSGGRVIAEVGTIEADPTEVLQ